jgi:hypothetical protein
MAKTAAEVRKRRTETPVPKLRTSPNTGTMSQAALVPVDKPLTDQQKQFVKFWAEGDSIPNAMKRAGYNDQPSYGYRMQKMPNIQALYRKYTQKYEEESKMTRAKVQAMHMEAFEMAKLLSEPASMVAAAREIGKLCGYYEPTRHVIDINVSANQTMQQMSRLTDAELLKIIEEGTKNEPDLLGFDDPDEVGGQ